MIPRNPGMSAAFFMALYSPPPRLQSPAQTIAPAEPAPVCPIGGEPTDTCTHLEDAETRPTVCPMSARPIDDCCLDRESATGDAHRSGIVGHGGCDGDAYLTLVTDPTYSHNYREVTPCAECGWTPSKAEVDAAVREVREAVESARAAAEEAGW